MASSSAHKLNPHEPVSEYVLRLVRDTPHHLRNSPPADEHNGGVSCIGCGSDDVSEEKQYARNSAPAVDEYLIMCTCNERDCGIQFERDEHGHSACIDGMFTNGSYK